MMRMRWYVRMEANENQIIGEIILVLKQEQMSVSSDCLDANSVACIARTDLSDSLFVKFNFICFNCFLGSSSILLQAMLTEEKIVRGNSSFFY